MEFEGQYLTYEEYKALGGTLDLMPFNLLEFEARNQVDLRTQNRLVNEVDIPQKVKICMFKLINRMNDYIETTNKMTSNGNLASETTDGYSVSYINASQISEVIKSKTFEIQDIILADLYGVIVNNEHIIFNGVV